MWGIESMLWEEKVGCREESYARGLDETAKLVDKSHVSYSPAIIGGMPEVLSTAFPPDCPPSRETDYLPA